MNAPRLTATLPTRTTRRGVGTVLCSIVLACCLGCHRATPEPVTITFMDPEWSHDRSRRSLLSEENLREFQTQTGIRVQHLPAPETSQQQLNLMRGLLRTQGSNPDVYGVDVVWVGLLDNELLDLRPFFASELSLKDQDLVASYTVNGKLVAVPYHTNVGVLLYRTDLLRKYGYHAPPQTWTELEKMALRIQQGERATGDTNFWGFVWTGASGEGLTCVALEWQMSDGGGTIIEPNQLVSVKNEQTIRAWRRAAHWVGWISPPSVTSYEEWDAMNYFDRSGEAAFRRGWTSDYFLTNSANEKFSAKIGITSLPSGSARSVATLGGFGLGVSRVSKHQSEAVELVRFLIHKESELEAARSKGELHAQELYRLPMILKAYSRSRPTNEGATIVSRPSAVAGRNYEKVSRAYAETVHSILVHKKIATDAAAAIEAELIRITGFGKGPPQTLRTDSARLK